MIDLVRSTIRIWVFAADSNPSFAQIVRFLDFFRFKHQPCRGKSSSPWFRESNTFVALGGSDAGGMIVRYLRCKGLWQGATFVDRDC